MNPLTFRVSSSHHPETPIQLNLTAETLHWLRHAFTYEPFRSSLLAPVRFEFIVPLTSPELALQLEVHLAEEFRGLLTVEFSGEVTLHLFVEHPQLEFPLECFPVTLTEEGASASEGLPFPFER